MLNIKTASGLATAALAAGLIAPCVAYADFIKDSKATLELRNFYMNSDNREKDAEQSKEDEWAQGFLLNYQSGFTQGPIGFGVDALGLLGLKLDSSPDRTGTDLLPVGDSGRAPADYSSLGMTAKARVSKTTLRLGTLTFRQPTLQSHTDRLLPQTFRGAQLVSDEIKGLSLNAGHLTQNKLRNQSGSENDDMTMSGKQTKGGQVADHFDFAGATYKWNKDLTTAYNYGHLDNNYEQHYLTLNHVLPLGHDQSFKSDLRFARSTHDGESNVDNDAMGAMFTYSLLGHSLGTAYQKMTGKTGFPYVNGSTAYLVNHVLLSNNFAQADEKSWQLRYDYDFGAIGLPGLSLMTRYMQGDNYQRSVGGEGKEWERDTDIAYTFQSGPLKDVGIKWRNGTYRSNSDGEIDENRLVISYIIKLM
ncbi:OprD family porin [Pseudomonas azerbaijanoccidentalis]